MLSDLIRTGPTHEPVRIVLHGVEGVGKTTFAAGAPDAVFIGPEDGGGDLNIDRIVVTTWVDFILAIGSLTSDPHKYRTLVIDTIDFMERLCQQSIAKGKPLAQVDGGFGNGYKASVEEQARAVHSLEVLRSKRRMNIIALAHTDVRRFDDPEDAAYDRYQLNMHKDAAKLWLGWADVVMFANYDIKVRVASGGNTPDALKKGKAVDKDPPRVLYTARRPAFDAKNRYSLPFEIPLSWKDFADAIGWERRDAVCRGETAPKLTTLKDLGDAMTAAKARGWTAPHFSAVVATFNVAKASEIPEARRGEALAIFQGAPPTTNQAA